MTEVAVSSKWIASGNPSAAAAAPLRAPATVPRLKAACSRGISGRSRRRSTSAPSMFIATSQTPTPRPTRNNPAPAGAVSAQCTPPARTSSPTVTVAPPTRTLVEDPKRCTTGPDNGNPATAPTDMHNRRRPSPLAVKARPSRAAGMREIHDARAIPLRANTTARAIRPRSAETRCVGAGAGTVSGRGSTRSSELNERGRARGPRTTGGAAG
jgi:hypothetical protein